MIQSYRPQFNFRRKKKKSYKETKIRSYKATKLQFHPRNLTYLPFIISHFLFHLLPRSLPTCPKCVFEAISYLSKLENKMLTNAPDCWFCKPSRWSDKTTISCARHSVKPATLASLTKPVGCAGRSIGFGRVSEGVRTRGAVNTGEGQFQENWTGVHMKLWVRLEPRLRAGFCCTRSPWFRNSRRVRGTVARLISGLAATCLHWDLVSPGPDMLWRNDVNPVRRLLTKFGYN